MGRNESTVELLVKVWEGIRKFLDVPKESTGSFFRHMRVGRFPLGVMSRQGRTVPFLKNQPFQYCKFRIFRLRYTLTQNLKAKGH